MRTGRLIGFAIAIMLGIIGGLIVGWLYRPVEVSNTTLDSLRVDYKADYVLMVAELYHNNGDLENAASLLKQISPGDPIRATQLGLVTAEAMAYEEWEMRLMADLEIALEQQVQAGSR